MIDPLYTSPWGDDMPPMSVRLANTLWNLKLFTRSDIMAALEAGELEPKKVRNYGWKCYQELHRIFGLPEPVKPAKKYTVFLAAGKKCPHCGKELS
jgi:hypothetical protein